MSDFPPTTQQVAVGDELIQQGAEFQQEFQEIMSRNVASFNAMLRENGSPTLSPKGGQPSRISSFLQENMMLIDNLGGKRRLPRNPASQM